MKMATVTVVVTAKGDMTVKMPETTTTQAIQEGLSYPFHIQEEHTVHAKNGFCMTEAEIRESAAVLTLNKIPTRGNCFICQEAGAFGEVHFNCRMCPPGQALSKFKAIKGTMEVRDRQTDQVEQKTVYFDAVEFARFFKLRVHSINARMFYRPIGLEGNTQGQEHINCSWLLQQKYKRHPNLPAIHTTATTTRCYEPGASISMLIMKLRWILLRVSGSKDGGSRHRSVLDESRARQQ